MRCSECGVVCHVKCQKNVTNTCGLPGGLFKQFKDGVKSSSLSPIASIFKGAKSDELHGKLKVLCGDDKWSVRYVHMVPPNLRISPHHTKSPSKMTSYDDVIDLTQSAYIHTDISQHELPSTAKQDLPYAFKVE